MEQAHFKTLRLMEAEKMELLYIWIEDYKNIHHQGFNFNNEYRFMFNPEIVTIKGLDIEDKLSLTGGTLEVEDLYPDIQNSQDKPFFDFFQSSVNPKNSRSAKHYGKIKNITAIVGQNGVGKSNLLEFIKIKYKNIFIEYLEEKEIERKYFIILKTESNDSSIKPKFYLKQSHKSFLIKKPTNFKFESTELKNPSHSGIFYSNIISNKNTIYHQTEITPDPEPQTNTIFDISSETIVYKRYYESMHLFGIIENISQMHFLFSDLYKEFSNVPFKNISSTTISLVKSALDNIDESNRIFIQTYFRNVLLSDTFNSISISSDPTVFKIKLKFLFYSEIIIKTLIRKVQNLEQNSFLLMKSQLIEKNIGTNFNDLKLYFITATPIIKDLIVKFWEKEFLKILDDCIESIFTLILKFNINGVLTERSFSFEFNVTEEIPDEFTVFVNNYLTSIQLFNYNYLNFEWSEMSTGEKAMLNLFARFNSIVEKKFSFENKLKVDTKNLLIFIDEGEIGFHPEWQRMYLQYLIDFFPKVYPMTQIQVILTTHSPFLLSDLPKDNIIFLQKGEDGLFIDGIEKKNKCITLDETALNKKDTFAANIYTLFSDSFFLNQGLIGEFAKNKINEVIDTLQYMNDRQLDLRQQEKIKSIIEIIGEPIIKRKLLEMYYDEKRQDSENED